MTAQTRFTASTLIELLVTIAIVALLISILLPSLQKAREQGKLIVCLTNLKSVGAGSLVYAESDVNEQAMPVHPLMGHIPGEVGAYDWGRKAGVGEPTAGTDPIYSLWGTAEGRGPGSRSLNHVLVKAGVPDRRDNPGPNQQNWIDDYTMDLPVVRCPSDRGYTGYHLRRWRDSGLSSYEHYGNSYCANNQWGARYSDGDDPSTCRVTSWSPFLRPLTWIPTPSNTLYYMENCGRFAWYFDWKPESCHIIVDEGLVLTDTGVTGWHRKPFQFAAVYVDGHANSIHMRGRTWPAPRLSHYPADVWGGLENQQGHYRCVVVRGGNWQLDCLPSPPVISDLHCSIGQMAIFLGN